MQKPLKFAPYSYSKLSCHVKCPRRFKYSVIDKVKKEKTDVTALLKGGAVHSILENYPKKSKHKHAHKHQHIVDRFVETKLGQKYLDKNSMNEVKFGLTVDFEPCDYEDKNAIFRGKIDYVVIIDNTLHLIDWKTGKYVEPRYQSFDQLLFYSLYFLIKYPHVDKIILSYVYIEHHDSENDIEIHRKYFNNYKKQLMKMIEDAENDKIFPKNPSKLCEWCPYKEHCSKDL